MLERICLYGASTYVCQLKMHSIIVRYLSLQLLFSQHLSNAGTTLFIVYGIVYPCPMTSHYR